MATYDFTVRAQDETGAFSDRDFSIQVRNNLVDRILAIDSNNAYASVDGTTWTERTGKGGDWCINLLGKWIVCTYAYSYGDSYRAHCGRDYRISDDTINWTEGLKFWLSNDAPEYDEQGNEVTPAGPLYHLEFYPTRDQFSVINGKIVIPSIVNGKLCIVYSTDAINWYAYESTQPSDASNMMGITEDALYESSSLSYTSDWYARSRHGLSNIVMHNGKYTMINNHTNTFYISDDLIDWEMVNISNKSDLGNMNVAISRTGSSTGSSSFRCTDNFWYILSVNNVLWMMGQANNMYHYTWNGTNQWRFYSDNYVFYTTNLTDISYSNNYLRNNDNTYDTSSKSNGYWDSFYFYPPNSAFYDAASVNSEHRHIYYANGVIFAYCSKDIVSTKTLTNNIRQNTGLTDNGTNAVTGSCYFEGDIYYVQNGSTTGYGVKKLTIDNNEYRTPSDVSGLPVTVFDITSV